VVAVGTVIVQSLLLRVKLIVGVPVAAAVAALRILEQNADARDVLVDFAVTEYV
jgi:hypothetical protein